MKRDEDSSPLVSDAQPLDDDDGRGRHPYKDRDRPLLSHFQSLCPFLGDDTKSSRISLCVLIIVALVGLVSIFAIVKRVVSILSLCFSCLRNLGKDEICVEMWVLVFDLVFLLTCIVECSLLV